MIVDDTLRPRSKWDASNMLIKHVSIVIRGQYELFSIEHNFITVITIIENEINLLYSRFLQRY